MRPGVLLGYSEKLQMPEGRNGCHPDAALRQKDPYRPSQFGPMAQFCVSPQDSSLRADEMRRLCAQNDNLFLFLRARMQVRGPKAATRRFEEIILFAGMAVAAG